MDKCEQACRGLHDKEFEPTEASAISRPSVNDGFDDDDVCGPNDTEASKLSLVGILNLEFEAEEDPVADNLEIWYWLFLIFTKILWCTHDISRFIHGIPPVY